MRGWWAAVAVGALGCGGSESSSQLTILGSALSAWERAEAQPEVARDALAEARAADPHSPALARAAARAARRANELPAAEALLSSALSTAGTVARGHVLWDRAVVRLERGDTSGALDDIEAAVKLGTIDRRALAADPDLAPLTADPRGARLLPQPTVRFAQVASETEVLSGESTTRTLAFGAPSGPRSVSISPPLPPQLTLARVVEDIVKQDSFEVIGELRVTLAARGSGEVSTGAWRLSAGRPGAVEQAATVTAATVQVVALGSAPAAPDAAAERVALPLPSAMGPTPTEPDVRRTPDGLVYRWPPRASCRVPKPAAAVQLELREAGQSAWEGVLVPASAALTLECAGGVRLSPP